METYILEDSNPPDVKLRELGLLSDIDAIKTALIARRLGWLELHEDVKSRIKIESLNDYYLKRFCFDPDVKLDSFEALAEHLKFYESGYNEELLLGKLATTSYVRLFEHVFQRFKNALVDSREGCSIQSTLESLYKIAADADQIGIVKVCILEGAKRHNTILNRCLKKKNQKMFAAICSCLPNIDFAYMNATANVHNNAL
jgi:hypothetical protein